LGIGTTNPLTSLHIKSNELHQFRLERTQPGPFGMSFMDELGSTRCFLGVADSFGDIVAQTSKGDVAMLAYNGKKLMLSAVGALSDQKTVGMAIVGNKVGIGTTSPTHELHVNGIIRADIAATTANSSIFLGTPAGDPGIIINKGTVQRWDIAVRQDNSFDILDNTAATSRLAISSAGNVGIGTTNPTEKLTVSGNMQCTTCIITSDRDKKDGFADVDPREVLEKVAAMPITKWHYKTETDVDHIGPMAQDFHAAFGIGTDDKHISTVDADGIALAAIKGLSQVVEEKDARITELERRLEILEQSLSK
jgi:hypothetical protein